MKQSFRVKESPGLRVTFADLVKPPSPRVAERECILLAAWPHAPMTGINNLRNKLFAHDARLYSGLRPKAKKARDLALLTAEC